VHALGFPYSKVVYEDANKDTLTSKDVNIESGTISKLTDIGATSVVNHSATLIEGMSGGPGLMFVALPKVFEAMGPVGQIFGAVFFIMVLFAALTSAMSVLEAVVSGLIDKFGMSRHKATVLECVIALAIGIVICLGYNVFYFEKTLPNGSSAQLLDIVDYLANNILMPIVAISTCILIGWVVKPDTVINEATRNGERFGRKGLYIVMIKFVAPVLLLVLFAGSLGLI
ncbi:MAG: hypothetical protein IJV58_02735, partial [Oscillospiraceae bacterium]|nr:hypothetical protein [Oscillospiraceae bacterium]